jgi:hypothetical protein
LFKLPGVYLLDFLQLLARPVPLAAQLDFQLLVSLPLVVLAQARPVELPLARPVPLVLLADQLPVLLVDRSDFVLDPKLNHPLFN